MNLTRVPQLVTEIRFVTLTQFVNFFSRAIFELKKNQGQSRSGLGPGKLRKEVTRNITWDKNIGNNLMINFLCVTRRFIKLYATNFV